MKLLKVVVETQNTHKAAEILGISQPTVSRGVSKLRDTFGEQLFLRKAHSIEPSELAIKLAEAADEMLTPISKVIESYSRFTPQQFTGKVSLAVNTYLLEVFAERLIQELSSLLPNATFELDYWQAQSLSELLKGKIDYVIQVSNYVFPQDVYTRTIKQVEMGVVARKDHPILSQSSNWDSLHSLPIVQLYLPDINYKKSALHDLYKSKGFEAKVILKTHSLKAALYTLRNSNAICYSSSYISNLDKELSVYSLPQLTKHHSKVDIIGAYLQTRRGYPLNQFLHQMLQHFFAQAE
ncbi:LysR family transcriptional regulator [Agarivorans sp. B2Z047]|uniref:LysR family transcriptional regulator n=1 Tax=Agarivorans sp. B2Z047 TaxID=2652721 RepID=UPI001D15CE48|nr:LysR family transcriptional regulator [Agarivorans sp. B2Z047]UQN40970.1 LysR family transcriptional regulator [Agarivorans sp. B2Z047]